MKVFLGMFLVSTIGLAIIWGFVATLGTIHPAYAYTFGFAFGVMATLVRK
jgi:hypothetical protein